MRFLDDVPRILDLIAAGVQMNIKDGYSYDCFDDMFNDWIMPYIENLPSDAWISTITNSWQASEVTVAMALDERFKGLLSNNNNNGE